MNASNGMEIGSSSRHHTGSIPQSSPAQSPDRGFALDVLTYSRFLEVFGYFSPAHGYSLQVTSLGLFAVLLGNNPALKQEALAVLEKGGLLAFAVSEKSHGSDLLANGFTVERVGLGPIGRARQQVLHRQRQRRIVHHNPRQQTG